jgi:hypothetical protein
VWHPNVNVVPNEACNKKRRDKTHFTTYHFKGTGSYNYRDELARNHSCADESLSGIDSYFLDHYNSNEVMRHEKRTGRYVGWIALSQKLGF